MTAHFTNPATSPANNQGARTFRTQAEMIEVLHDMSMSSDPQEACKGRILKRVIPAIEEAQREEFFRQTPPGMILIASHMAAHNILGNAIANTIRHPSDLVEIRQTLVDDIDLMLRQIVDSRKAKSA